jgi:hypothetical protein
MAQFTFSFDVCWQNERTHREFPACEAMTARYKTLPAGSEKDQLKMEITQRTKSIKVSRALFCV